MTNRAVDNKIAELARRQHGLFTYAQVIDAGGNDGIARRRREAGQWIRRADGLYQLASAAPGWPQELQAALLAHDGAVVSHRAAAALHGWLGYREGPVDVSVGGAPNYRSAGTVYRTQDLVANDCTVVQGFPATTELRTVIDVAAVTGRKRLELLVDDLLAAKIVSLEQLRARFEEIARRGKPRMANLRQVLDARGPGYVPPASRLERKVRKVLAAAGLPEPVRQHPRPSRVGPGRVDFAYPHRRVIIEADSRRYHTRLRDFERDRQRDNEAAALGWVIIRVTWAELRDHPERFVQQVRDCLQRAA